MRWALIATAILVAGCNKAEPGNRPDEQAVSERSGPGVGVTNIPGVSLSYQYGFRLPIQQIAKVQELHAAQCEALTPARCRITGMQYQVDRNRTITAALNLKLAPELARRFGKQGVDTVIKQGGMLADARIDSEESGVAIATAERDEAAIASERNRITDQLSKSGLGSVERMELQAQLAELSNQRRQSQSVRNEAALKLASTPMTFNYESGDVAPGLNDGPILGAVKDGWANIIIGFATILHILITLTPWVVTAALLIWLWRRFGHRLGLRNMPDES